MSTATTTEFFLLHRLWEADRPSEAAAEEAYEQARQVRWQQAHGSLDGYRSPREFPCSGALRVFDRVGGVLLVECDSCGFTTGVARNSTKGEYANA